MSEGFGRKWPVLVNNWPVIASGVLIVAFSLALMPWPPAESVIRSGRTSYYDRLTRRAEIAPSEGNAGSFDRIRQVFDAFTVIFLGVGGALLIRFRRLAVMSQSAYIAILGILGVASSVLAGLEPGPILSTTGFAFMVSGAGIAWASNLESD